MNKPNFNDDEKKLIEQAARYFEDPGLFMRLLGYTGNWAEDGVKRLPEKWQAAIKKASTVAIEKCLWAAVKTVASQDNRDKDTTAASQSSKTQSNFHTAATAVTGAVSGFFGPEMLIWELPVSTSIMMRSIASSAQEFGFDLNDPSVLLECLFVFSIGGPNPNDDGMDSSYLANKLAFQSAMKAAAEAIAGIPAKTLLSMIENQSAPALVRLIAVVADSFGLRVTKKLIAQMAPIIGAVGGAGINIAFSEYFGNAARHHFALKKLALKHSGEFVNEAYQLEAEKIRALKLAKAG